MKSPARVRPGAAKGEWDAPATAYEAPWRARLFWGCYPSPDPLMALSESNDSCGPSGERINRRSLLYSLDLTSPREDAVPFHIVRRGDRISPWR